MIWTALTCMLLAGVIGLLLYGLLRIEGHVEQLVVRVASMDRSLHCIHMNFHLGVPESQLYDASEEWKNAYDEDGDA